MTVAELYDDIDLPHALACGIQRFLLACLLASSRCPSVHKPRFPSFFLTSLHPTNNSTFQNFNQLQTTSHFSNQQPNHQPSQWRRSSKWTSLQLAHYLTFKADTPPGTPPTTSLRPSRVPPARLRPKPTSKSPRTLMPPWAPVPLPPRTPLVTRWTRRATRYVQAHDIFTRITG